MAKSLFREGVNLKNFEKAWMLYQEAFPEDERRSLSDQIELMENNIYNFKFLCDNGEFTGFIAYWELEDFTYIDHFAIEKKRRGRGLGKKALADFLSRQSRNVVLEVEKAKDRIAKKRIAFYERLGFFLNEYDYLQPAYSIDKRPVPLLIMSFPSRLDKKDFDAVKRILYRDVYSI